MLFLETPCGRRPAIASPDAGRREREAGRTSALDPAGPAPLRVVMWMAFALRLHPLGNLEFVVELKHDPLLKEKSGSRIADPRCALAHR